MLSRSGFWYDSRRTIQEYSNHVPFSIGKGLAEVSDWSEATELDLDVTYDKFEPAGSSWSDHLWGWATGDRQRGVQSTEKMLVNGADMTVIGELVLNPEDGLVKLQTPSNPELSY